MAPASVGVYIGDAYFFTSSTGFANPAFSVGRIFSNAFAGIVPASVPAYVAAQLLGGVCAVLAIPALYPDVTPADAADVILSHERRARGLRRRAGWRSVVELGACVRAGETFPRGLLPLKIRVALGSS
jgi:glycerol uptake facilitator-like aquaporin